MSIIFFGTPEFAIPSLNALIKSGEDISLVVTQTDKVKGRGHKLSPPPVKVSALEAGLRVVQPERITEEAFLAELASCKPEFIVVVAYGRILPKKILDLPLRGCINVHASLLPKYRGAAPVAWAIIHGEERTGVTTMRMDEGLDTGHILLQRVLEVGKEDTTGSLGRKLSDLGASLLVETLKGVRENSVRPLPQTGQPSYAPPLRKEDGHIDWSKSAGDICNFVRGMQPWPGAFCHIDNERVTLLKAAPGDGRRDAGVISEIQKDSFIVGTGHGLLSILELQPAGKNPMSASAFIHGRRLSEGMRIR